jgi:hypothetical protein
MEECIIHYNSVSEQKLVKLSSETLWKTLLQAAERRKFQPIIDISSTVTDGEYPPLKYHKTCRSMFTLKRDLVSCGQEVGETSQAQTNPRSSLRLASQGEGYERMDCDKLLPNCIFCNKAKRVRKTDTKEKLLSCAELRADDSIRKASLLRGDQRIAAITTDDLIAKEAKYHKTCYRNYTRVNYKVVKDYQSNEDEPFDGVKEILFDLYDSPDVIEYAILTKALEDNLRGLDGVDEKYINSAKRNLKRKNENLLNGFNFLTVNSRLLVYPDTLSIRDMISKYYILKIEAEKISNMKEDEKTTLRAAHLIREEVRAMEDVMPWPPQEIDLDEEKLRLSHHLSLFLDKLLNLRFTEQPSPRICRLKSSFGQDIVYAVSRGRIKTPKSIMYPYTIKSLTNCTELIDISSRLGHGISRSLVEELTTENAYRVMDQQNEGTVALPPGSKEETFTIAVYDNIDRQEETLSGKFRFQVLIV